MKPKGYYRRTLGLLRPRALRKKLVVIIGQGSGGSHFSLHLGQLGVQMTLVERPDELLLEHNVIRHVLGYDSLSKPKLTAMADCIRRLYPSAQVRTVEMDVTAQKDELAKLVAQHRPDLIAALEVKAEPEAANRGAGQAR